MMVVVLLYRTNLPYSVETCPWCRSGSTAWRNRSRSCSFSCSREHLVLPRVKHSELQDEFGFLSSELLLDLPSHPIEADSQLFLISA